jgi:diaminopimelate epimerase
MADILVFWKMTGAGNDFLLGDNRRGRWDGFDLPALARGLCRRALSVGGDGLILIDGSEKADYGLRIFNSDGSPSPMCGNGARCAFRLAQTLGICGDGAAFEAGGHLLRAEAKPGGAVRVEVPGEAAEPRQVEVDAQGRRVLGMLAEAGVPHFVVFVKDVESIPVAVLGRVLRNAPELGPEGANVDFVSLDGGEPYALRTYERGVEGETLACGTGATAVAWVLHKLGKAGRDVRLLARSGWELVVEMDPDEAPGPIFRLTGEARLVYKGALNEESIEEALACCKAE